MQRREVLWQVDMDILAHLLGNYSTAILACTSVIFVNMISQSYSRAWANPGYTGKMAYTDVKSWEAGFGSRWIYKYQWPCEAGAERPTDSPHWHLFLLSFHSDLMRETALHYISPLPSFLPFLVNCALPFYSLSQSFHTVLLVVCANEWNKEGIQEGKKSRWEIRKEK